MLGGIEPPLQIVLQLDHTDMVGEMIETGIQVTGGIHPGDTEVQEEEHLQDIEAGEAGQGAHHLCLLALDIVAVDLVGAAALSVALLRLIHLELVLLQGGGGHLLAVGAHQDHAPWWILRLLNDRSETDQGHHLEALLEGRVLCHTKMVHLTRTRENLPGSKIFCRDLRTLFS